MEHAPTISEDDLIAATEAYLAEDVGDLPRGETRGELYCTFDEYKELMGRAIGSLIKRGWRPPSA